VCCSVLLHLLWALLSSACLLLISLVCELISVCPSWSRSPTVPWPCCSLLLGWACGAICYLSFWSRSVGICCGGLLLLRCYVLSCTSFLLSWSTHSLCGLLLLSHPSLCTSCILDHFLCGTWCPVIDLVLVLWVLLFLSWVLCFLASSVGVLHWCDLRYLPFVLSM